jgi:DNA-binding LacI/PurR family transcriptional regulator
MQKRVTLQQVALRVGCSVATASHALSGSGSVRAETRERVRAAAEALGYRPDPMLSALATYRRQASQPRATANLAFLVYPLRPTEWSRGHVAQDIYQAARGAAEELGYALDLFDLNEWPDLEKAARVLLDRGVRGLIFPFHRNRPDLPGFPLAEFAAVEIGALPAVHPEMDRVTMNDFQAMRITWSQLRARGYRRIGLALSASTDANSGGAWSAAYLAAQRAADLPDPPPIHELGTEAGDYFGAFRAWYEEHRPDAVISRKSVRAHLEALGLRAPEDIGYANLGVPEIGAPTSGTVFNQAEIGRNAVAMLDHSLRHGRLGLPACPRTVLLHPRWNEGRTLRPPEGRADGPPAAGRG